MAVAGIQEELSAAAAHPQREVIGNRLVPIEPHRPTDCASEIDAIGLYWVDRPVR